jgi:glycosyltransferase involved in cell wall biosynthesis
MTKTCHPSDSPSTVAISVAIPAFGHAASLRQTLERIAACVPLPSEVLIHADGGWQVPAEVLAELPFAVNVLASAQRLGPGGGRHRLILAASHDIIASFDDDSWPLDADYFARALALMQAFPKVAVLSPAVYLREKPPLPLLPEATLARSFDGSGSVIRRSMYLQLPGYVPVPAAYGVEEADLSLQIHATGFDILSSPWLRAWHDRPQADNRHTILPWIRNEVLLAYLRFPLVLQPLGWLRALRHVWRHRQELDWQPLLSTLAQSFPDALRYESHRHRYSWSAVWRHHRTQPLRFALQPLSDSGTLAVKASACPPGRKILFLQYTNPGSYPPLEHSSRLLAREGWEVAFCGIRDNSKINLMLAPFPRIRQQFMAYQRPGLAQKIHYARFTFWCLRHARRWQPDWVYASDALAAPAAALIQRFTRAQILYHEHDSPTSGAQSNPGLPKTILRFRRAIGRRAAIVVLPNQQRLERFIQTTHRAGPSFCVWNCPSRDEVPSQPPERSPAAPLKVLYHGSIVPDRFGPSILEAVAACPQPIHLRLMGYLPPGHLDYGEKLMAKAQALGIADRFEYLGPIPHRADLIRLGAECDVGLCLLRIHEGDVNMQHMAGASNKAFDYLSQGLALIVPPDPEWERLYVQNGCAKTCPINDAEKLATVFQWMADHREDVAELGRHGHQLVQERWNYEKQFAPVMAQMYNSITSSS